MLDKLATDQSSIYEALYLKKINMGYFKVTCKLF